MVTYYHIDDDFRLTQCIDRDFDRLIIDYVCQVVNND